MTASAGGVLRWTMAYWIEACWSSYGAGIAGCLAFVVVKLPSDACRRLAGDRHQASSFHRAIHCLYQQKSFKRS